jgi:hypothetical protein
LSTHSEESIDSPNCYKILTKRDLPLISLPAPDEWMDDLLFSPHPTNSSHFVLRASAAAALNLSFSDFGQKRMTIMSKMHGTGIGPDTLEI